MLLRVIPLLVPLLAASVLVHPREAEACSFPPPIDVHEDLAAGLTGIPTRGVVPIFVTASLSDVEPGYPQMTVRDGAGGEIAGTLELTETRLVWRAAAPLAPSTTYAAVLAVDSWGQTEFWFSTAADDTIPALVFEPGDVHVREEARADRQICCDAALNSCGFEEFAHCWTQEATYLPRLDVVLAVDVEAARYFAFDHEAPGATSSYSSVGSRYGSWMTATYPRARAEYCMTVRARSLTGGDDVVEEVCQSHDALEPLPPFVAEQPDYGMCDDPPVDPETHEEVDTGGCSSGGSDGGAGAVLIALAAAVLARRRRAL